MRLIAPGPIGSLRLDLWEICFQQIEAPYGAKKSQDWGRWGTLGCATLGDPARQDSALALQGVSALVR